LNPIDFDREATRLLTEVDGHLFLNFRAGVKQPLSVITRNLTNRIQKHVHIDADGSRWGDCCFGYQLEIMEAGGDGWTCTIRELHLSCDNSLSVQPDDMWPALVVAFKGEGESLFEIAFTMSAPEKADATIRVHSEGSLEVS